MDIADLLRVCQEAVTQVRSQILTLSVILVIHGVGAHTAVHAHHIALSVCRVSHFPEEGGAANGVTRSQHAVDGDIAQGNRLLIGIETIRLEILRMGILVDVDGLLRAGLHEFPVLFGHVHLCAGQLFHDSCGSTVIKVRVADEDLFDLLRTIAQAVDGIHQHVSTLRDCRVDEDQPVPCVN